MKKNKISITTPLIAAVTILLVAANLLLGFILTTQSRKVMRQLTEARMLDISNTAARLLDGDKMARLTAEDVGSEDYDGQLSILRTYQETIDLEYIYGIRADGNGRFSFTIDPEPDDPGQFGEEIKYTKALDKAAHGTAAVDKEPYTDRWGSFYSSYSPIFDSSGNVVGIVGVDFSAEWYQDQITKQVAVVVIVCVVSTVMGVALALILSLRIRRRFTELYGEMNSLAGDFEDLGRLIQKENDETAAAEPQPEEPQSRKRDEIAELCGQIRTMQKELRQYLTFVNSQAYADSMTGVGNKSAYLKKVRHLNKRIAAGDADFTVFVFDLNGLKKINDNYGHEMGDEYILGASTVIKKVFGMSNVYRIGGDEFISIIEGCTDEDIDSLFRQFDKAQKTQNKTGIYPVMLTVSRGAGRYRKGDQNYNQVFKRADEEMYHCKEEFYNSSSH